MRSLFTFLLIIASLSLIAQTPISHQPGVSFTYSGSYYVAGGAATNDFIMCNSWNSGANGGWLQMDLGATNTLESLRYWRGMAPNGTVVSELVEVSPDGTTWTLAANNSGYHYSLEETKLVFDPVLADVRYIRISQSGTPSWFAILEMVVNNPFYAANIYANLPPKILDSSGNELEGPVSGFPYTLMCSKADTYQWYKNGVLLSGETNQSYIATEEENYSCAVTYSTTNCGFPTISDEAPLVLLPLDLLSFRVMPKNDQVLLNWEVANLLHFSHYDIQRSTDGYTFEKIKQIPTADVSHYSYLDESPPGGTLYYRLKLVDLDGQFDYSPIKSLQFDKTEITLFPNPVQEVLHIQSSKDHYDFSIYDLSGKRLYQGQASGENHLVTVAHFPKGMYYLQVGEKVSRFVVQ